MNDIVRDVETEDAPELRPIRLDDFKGQNAQIENLRDFIHAARQRGEPLDHALFYGGPGLGKTTLSRLIAAELGVGFRGISAPAITKPADLVALLMSLAERDVLFIDETHRLSTVVEEYLYTAMEDFMITVMVPNDQGIDEPHEVPIKPFTLIGATTRKGLLSRPLLERFGGMTFLMELYNDEDLAGIVQRAGLKLGETLDYEQALAIAKRSRGTPRTGLHLLKRVRDFRQIRDCPYSIEFVEECLDRLGLDRMGLNDLDRRYLTALKDRFKGGPVGIETLATAIDESRETLETTVEPYLIRNGLVARTPRGRTALDPDLFSA
jgi:holliday junction DNA helicase RuvB